MTTPAGLPGGRPTVHLVRHGQSSWNLRQLVQGQQSSPELTDLGRRQAGSAARKFAGGRPAGRLLTSDLTRATQTAQIIGATIGLVPISTKLLREQSLGALEGLPTREASRLLADVDLSDPDVRYAGGESRSDVADRIATLFASPLITDLGPTDGVVLVSHGDTIRIAIAYLLGERQQDAPWRTIDNGSVVTLDPLDRAPSSAAAAAPGASIARRDR